LKFLDTLGLLDFLDTLGLLDFLDTLGLLDFLDALGLLDFLDALGLLDLRDDPIIIDVFNVIVYYIYIIIKTKSMLLFIYDDNIILGKIEITLEV